MKTFTAGDISWQWIAGFFDGEGCIGFHSRIRKDNRDRGGRQLSITQKFPGVLHLIQKKCSKEGIASRVIKQGRYSRLIIQNKKNIKEFLIRVLLYSVIKKKQIELALELLSSIKVNNTKRIPDKELNERIKITQKIKQLKRKETVRLK